MTIHAPIAVDPDAPGPDAPGGPEPQTVVVEVPVAVPTWTAGNAAWWAISVVVAAMAVALFTLLRTVSAVSDDGTAEDVLTAVLRAPTEAAAEDALADDPGATDIDVREDLVVLDVAAADLRDDFDATIDEAVRDRVDALRADGIPVDPGADRTPTGVPRPLIESLSIENHEVVERGVLLSAILAGALLAFTLLQGRDDNLLMLPAGALAVAWVFVTIALQLVRMVLDGTGPGTSQVVRIIEASAAAPRQQLTFAVFAAVLGGAAYRLLTQWQAWRRRRALERYRAAVAEQEEPSAEPGPAAVERVEPEPDVLIDLEHEEVVLGRAVDEPRPDDARSRLSTVPVVRSRARSPRLTD